MNFDYSVADIVIALLICGSLLIAILSGMLANLLRLLVTFGAIACTLFFAHYAALYIEDLAPAGYALPIGGLGVYVFVGIFGGLTVRIISSIPAVAHWGSIFSHFAGLLVGMCRLFVVIIFWTLMAGYLYREPNVSDVWSTSKVLKTFGAIAQHAKRTIPDVGTEISQDLREMFFLPPSNQPHLRSSLAPKQKDAGPKVDEVSTEGNLSEVEDAVEKIEELAPVTDRSE